MCARSTQRTWTTPVLLSLVAALATVCVAECMLGGGGAWWTKLVFVSGCFLLNLVLVGYPLSRQLRVQESVREYLERVTQLDYHDVNEQNLDDGRLGIGSRNPWKKTLRDLREFGNSLAERLRASENERVRTEVRARHLGSQHGQLEEIVTGLTDPVLAIDHFDELVLSNPSAQQLFDLPSESLEERALRQMVRCEELVRLLTDTRRRKAPAQRTTEIKLTDGRGGQQLYQVTCRSISAAIDDGEPTDPSEQSAIAILTEISDKKAIHKRHAEFVSAAAHEMKTPLAGIKAYVELLADGEAEDEETCEEFLEVINGQADRLQRLIDNMLNLARIEAGVVEVRKQTHSLNELLEEAAGVVAPAAERKRIELAMNLSSMYLGVLADRDMILQSAINLLSNAIKYTDVGGTVTLRSRVDGTEAAFEVEDTGVGLSPEDCEKVFDKFYRVKKDSQMASGTGLGLPLAKHIVEDVHGGRLALKSELGKGSTFRVALPNVDYS